jgi:hypothetical protein
MEGERVKLKQKTPKINFGVLLLSLNKNGTIINSHKNIIEREVSCVKLPSFIF